MIELVDTKYFDNPPGHPGTIGTARMVDKSKGTKKTDAGLLVWAWDKSVTVSGRDRAAAVYMLNRRVFKIVSGEESI